MAITIRTRTKSDLAQIRDPSVLRLHLPSADSCNQWVDRVQARVKELTEAKITCMKKPEFQALLLVNNLPNTIIWQRFQAKYKLESRPGVWNEKYYEDDKWMLTLESFRALLHLHLVDIAHSIVWGSHPAKKVASEEVTQFRPPGHPWRIPGKAPPTPPDSDEESSIGDNLSSRSLSQSPVRKFKRSGSTESFQSTLASKRHPRQ